MDRALPLLCLAVALLAGRPAAAEEFDRFEPRLPRQTLPSQDEDPAAAVRPADEPSDALPSSGPCDCCGCEKCRKLNEKAAGAYKTLFYDNDFSYLNDPCYRGGWIGDRFKQLHHGCSTFDFGGQYRARYHHENNMRGLGLTGRDDDFLLHRTRLFANWKYSDYFRAYVEYIDAVSEFENFRPRPIEENRSDLLNAFGEVLLYGDCCGQMWARVGRQELLYGAQRTVSPLDWANTRRTFDGAKLYWRGCRWDVDVFATRPVFPNARHFDNPLNSQHFVGAYSVYKGWKDRGLDLYFLRYADDGSIVGPFDFNTFGARYHGTDGPWLWEMEAAYQTGEFQGANVSAGAYTLGIGHAWKCAHAKPTLWLYYDWASGDETQGAGYHHLFPLSHKYLGFMDFFGRRNIQDLNLLLETQPHKKLKFLAWMHAFWLQNRNDVPYTVAMTPSPAGFGVVPGGSKELGQELDLLAVWTINERMSLLGGYSHFWTGDWFTTNPTPGLFTGDADFVYTQFHVNF